MNNLRKIRKEKNLKMKELALILNVGIQQIQRLETGKNKLNEDQIRILCNKIKVSADYLLGLIDKEKEPYTFTKESEEEIKKVLEKNADFLKKLIKE